MESTPEKRKAGRPPGKFKQGEGNPKRSVRLEGDLLTFVDEFPGGLLGVVRAAHANRAKLK